MTKKIRNLVFCCIGAVILNIMVGLSLLSFTNAGDKTNYMAGAVIGGLLVFIPSLVIIKRNEK